MKIVAFLLVTLVFTSATTQAAIFDAPDFLDTGTTSVSALGEILLSDPTSEGVEGHVRHGLSPDWNVGAVIGSGSKNKNFRLGGEGLWNFFTDGNGDLSVSGLFSAQYLKRNAKGGMLFRVAPLVHKKMMGWSGLPITIYGGVPLYLEARSGSYTTGSQLVLGAVADLDSDRQFYLAADSGIKLSKSESYVALGLGYRFDTGTIEMEDKRQPASTNRAKRRPRASGDEYRTEDFE